VRVRAHQRVAGPVAIATSGAMVLMMLWAPATAQAAPTTAAVASPVRVQRLCSLPKPGYRACMALRVVGSVTPESELTPDSTPSGYGPADLSSAYNLPSTGGSGVTVAVVDAMDDPDAASDLATYRSTFGLPPCTAASGCFTKVNQNGGTTYPAPDAGWSGEIVLDIEMVSAACPSCKILLVEANSANDNDLDTAVNYAAAHATVVSNSYGGAESSSDPSDSAYNHPGVLITASSGDEGYEVEFPAASPSVLAVGGTSLSHSGTGRGWTESVWSTSSSEGAGSGCSRYETQPSWQTSNSNIKAVCSKRAVADVSAVADPATGVAVLDTYGSGGWTVFGGTSVASPLVAAIYALTGHAGGSPSYAYSNPANFYDVTSGQTSTCGNALCKAGTGWDGPTGIGTPNGTAMAAGSIGSDFSISANPLSVAAGGSGTSTVTTAVTSGSAETVTLGVSGLPSSVTASIAPSSVTSGGSATATVTVGSAVAPGNYTLTVTGTAASGSHSASFTLTVVEGPPTITSFSPTSGPVGTVITINGSNLEGATNVTINGLAGTITKDTAGKLKVKVPVGATTGKIKVVAPGGSAKTATVFTVT
jgi:subtilase family serine protease